MALKRELLLKKLTGLLKRITDADDDYTVTADQRAALMELETLTWNYPTPQQARGGLPPSITSSHHAHDDDTEDDDDDDDSYYVDMLPPYDMTERLKEVNRALVEDPTPAISDRAITVRFREVIADYLSPRESFPSDSDDGYGDSSDLLYDAEEEGNEGASHRAGEGKEVLSGNVKVVDLVGSANDLTQNALSDFNILRDTINGTANGDINSAYIGLSNGFNANESKVSKEDGLTDVPKLKLGYPEEIQNKQTIDILSPEAQVLSCEKTFLKVNDSGIADLETFMRENGSAEIPEVVIEEAENVNESETEIGSVSLIEVGNSAHVSRGFSSLGDMATEEVKPSEVKNPTEDSESDMFFQRGASSREAAESSSHYMPAKSEADFISIEYSDDFEELDESDDVGVSSESTNKTLEVSSPVAPAVPPADARKDPEKVQVQQQKIAPKASPVTTGTSRAYSSPQITQEIITKQGGHRSRKDMSSRNTSNSSSVEKTRKPVVSSRSPPSESVTKPSSVRSKAKRVPAGPPMIKPALLSSNKMNSVSTLDQSRRKPKTSLAAKPGINSSVSSPSPLSSASSSSSSSSSAIRGRSQTPASGPVRPTQHRSSGGASNGTPRGVSSSPVRGQTGPPHGLTLTPMSRSTSGGRNPAPPGQSKTQTGRVPPPHKVRKAASASDLHRASAENEERNRQNDNVFQAWLHQKNKQATLSKKHQRKSSKGRSSTEIAERRARAEEAFQAWLARKREQLRLEKRLRGERRRLEDQSRYARTKAECDVAYREWCRRKRDEVRTTTRVGVGVPRSQSLERPWVQEKTRKLYSAYLNGH